MIARCLVSGEAAGAPFRLDEPLSFWGGFDCASGRVIDRFHPQHGDCLSGSILFVARGRGSSSGASVLAEAIRIGTAPVAIVLQEDDAIITTGALVAQMLYGIDCPVISVGDKAEWQRLAVLPRLEIVAGADAVRFIQPAG